MTQDGDNRTNIAIEEMMAAVRSGVNPVSSAISLLEAIGCQVAWTGSSVVRGVKAFDPPPSSELVQSALCLVCDQHQKMGKTTPRLMNALLSALAKNEGWVDYLRSSQDPHAFVRAAYEFMTVTHELTWLRVSACNAMSQWLVPGAGVFEHPHTESGLDHLEALAYDLSALLLKRLFGEHWTLILGTDDRGLIDPQQITLHRPPFAPGLMPAGCSPAAALPDLS
jgi:hypothetical protein